MKYFISLVNNLSRILQIIAGVILVGIMVITCMDVVGNAFGHPILGVEELVSIMAAITMAFVLPAAHKNRVHIGIDILYSRLGEKFKKLDDLFVCILSGILFFLASWKSLEYAHQLKQAGEVTSTLQIPVYWMLYGVSLGCIVLFFVIVAEFIGLISKRKD